jgi:hypothetical protein
MKYLSERNIPCGFGQEFTVSGKLRTLNKNLSEKIHINRISNGPNKKMLPKITPDELPFLRVCFKCQINYSNYLIYFKTQLIKEKKKHHFL